MEADLAELEAALGHGFASRELLVRALTHRSLAKRAGIGRTGSRQRQGRPSTGDNERLEFLGDAVLGLVVAEALFAAHPEWQEGELTRVRAQLVSRQHMAEVAEAIGLGSHLRLSRGEDRSGLRRKSTVLSNSMEAVSARCSLTAAWSRSEPLCAAGSWAKPPSSWPGSCSPARRWATTNRRCRSICRPTRAGTPVYRVKSESGPDHRKRFLVEVRAETRRRRTGKAAGARHGQHQEATPSRMPRGARWKNSTSRAHKPAPI